MTQKEQEHSERTLLGRLKEHKSELEEALKSMDDRWHEDHFYPYYHGSFKVYSAQSTTARAVKLLRKLLPERELNPMFERLVQEDTGKVFQIEHKDDWERLMRPMLEAFSHAKLRIEMAVRYTELNEPPKPMPSGYAALLYLYNMR